MAFDLATAKPMGDVAEAPEGESPSAPAKKKGFDISTARFAKPTFGEAASDAASDVWSETKKAGGELAAIADLPASLPSMLAKGVGFTGGVVGTGAAALKAGKPVTRKELLEEGARTGEEFAAPLANPVQRLMRYFGHEDDYTQSDVQNALGVFSGWLKKGNKWIEDKTGGVVREEEADQIENALMAGGPVEAAKSVMKLRAKKAGGEPAKPGRVEPGPLPSEPGEFTEEQRSRLNELERASSMKPRYTLGPDGKPVKMASGRILTNEEKAELGELRRAKARATPPKTTEADDFIKRMDKESEEISKGSKKEEKPIEPAGQRTKGADLIGPVEAKARESVGKRFSGWLDKVTKDQGMDIEEQRILGDMEKYKENPQHIADDFWKSTYTKLPLALQTRFKKILAEHIGRDPKSTENLAQAVKDSNLTSNVKDLEKTKREFVALMREANFRFSGLEARGIAAEEPVTSVHPSQPFADEAKWSTPLLKRIAAAGEERVTEAKTRFEETKETERRRGKQTWELEEHKDAARRSEDQLRMVQDELDRRSKSSSNTPVPKSQSGKADPKLLAGAAAGIIVGSATAGDDHRVSGALAGALGGALLVGAFAARMFPRAEGGVPARELSSALDKLVGKQKAKQLELLKFASSVPKDYSQHAEQIYHSLEDPTVKLSPRAAELKIKYVDPIMRQNALLREDLKKRDVDVGEDVDTYVHRIPKGKPSIFEPLESATPQGKTLSQFAPPLEERTAFKLTDPETGETLYGVKNETGQGYKVYRDKEIVGSGKVSPKLWKEGKVPFGGRILKRSQATTKELETHTPLEYHHDALASAISSNARLARIRNNNIFLENFLKSPEASDVALKTGAPKGWREVPQIPQLRGYKFAPRVANVLEDFAGRQGSDLAENIGHISRILTGSLFWNPLPHIFNVLDHSIVQRGLVSGWLNPVAYPRLIRTTIKASKAVTEQSEDYLRFVKEGAGLMYPNVLISDFSRKVLEQLGQRSEMGVVAQAWGYANPAEMVRRIYAFSRENLWAANDILMMQAYLEKEMVKPETAIAEVEKHIPNYRVPDVVLGSRMVSQALQSPIVTAFGRYDYGRMKSYGEMVKGLVGKDRGLKDRAKALDQIAMLTVMGVVVYPLLMDNMAKTITGNPNAEATRFGASGILYLVYSYIHGRKQFSQVVGSAYPPGMAAKATAEIVSNRDLFTGRHLFEDSSDIAPYLAKQLSPIGTASRIESGQQTFGQFAASAVGIRSPQTPEQKRALTAKRRREQTRKRIDAILNR